MTPFGRWKKEALVASLAVLFLQSSALAEEPLMINRIAVDPKDPKILYAAGRPEGLLKSVDRGNSWSPARAGLKNTSAYHLVIDPIHPRTLYLATFGGGVYKSIDAGDSWAEANDGLGNTNIHALAIDPNNPTRLVVGTSTGELFKSEDGGSHWLPFSEGLPPIEGEVIATILFDPEQPSRLYLAQDGLYTRGETGPWAPLGEGLKRERITTLVRDPDEKTLYAGTKNGGAFVSRDGGRNWELSWPFFEKQWVQNILLQRTYIYVSILTKGLFRSPDQGKTWEKIDGGLPPDDDVMSLASDPQDPRRLYAGTHNKGIFLSSDGGARWVRPAVRQEPVALIIESLYAGGSDRQANPPSQSAPPVPAVFSKCSRCHGWADAALSQKKTYWRVSPNHRDWRPTVKRMAPASGLTPEEEEVIARFLENYTRARTPS